MTPVAAVGEPLRDISAKLQAGAFVEAEKLLAQMILDHVGRPDGPSLFRLFQLSPNDGLVERFDEIKTAVENAGDPLLSACFETIVGPWAVDELSSRQHDHVESSYQGLADAYDQQENRGFLFEERSDELLWINLNIPISTCNYRCSYCYLNHEVKPSLENIRNLDLLIERLGKIPRPIAITLSTAGEILAMPTMFPAFAKAVALPNVVFVETWTNLSRDLTGITKYIPIEKLAVLASYHPSEFKDYEQGHRAFMDRVRYLRDNAYDITVNFVVASVDLPYFPRIKRELAELDVFFTVNPLIGARNGDGMMFPQAYPDRDVVKVYKWYGCDVAAYFQMVKHANLRCTAGRDHIDIRPDGTVSRCEHLAKVPTEPNYGNLLSKEGPVVDLVSRYCAMQGCACKSTIGYAEPVVAEYKRIGTQHHFVKRPPGEIGTHSYDPVPMESIVPTPLPASMPEVVESDFSAQLEAERRVKVLA